jgi:hypothetical protein
MKNSFERLDEAFDSHLSKWWIAYFIVFEVFIYFKFDATVLGMGVFFIMLLWILGVYLKLLLRCIFGKFEDNFNRWFMGIYASAHVAASFWFLRTIVMAVWFDQKPI